MIGWWRSTSSDQLPWSPSRAPETRSSMSVVTVVRVTFTIVVLSRAVVGDGSTLVSRPARGCAPGDTPGVHCGTGSFRLTVPVLCLQTPRPRSSDRRRTGPRARNLATMTPVLVPPADRRRGWGALARRLDPFVDPAIAVLAVALGLASLLSADVGTIDSRLRPPDVLAAVATVVAAGSLAWRRTRPRLSYGVFLAGAVVVSGSYHYIGLLSVMVLFSLYSLTTHASRRDAALGLGAGIACFAGLAVAGVPDLRVKDLLLAVSLLVAAWAVGEVVRTRREGQRDQVRTAIAEERLRIARELHDVVAHSMSLIAVQARVGAHVIQVDPAAARRALEVIAETSRKALEQTRSTLGVLREENEEGNRPPTQGLDDLPALVKDVSAAGLDVDLVRSGTVPRLDATVSLTA